MIALGSKVADRVTGFAGTATARCEYLYTGPRVQVEAHITDPGKGPAVEWFDESRLETDDE